MSGPFLFLMQEKEVSTVHYTGAAILFISGNIYAWTQVVISSFMRDFGLVGLWLLAIRFIFSLLATISFVLFLKMMSDENNKRPSGDTLHWQSDDPGYVEHVVADEYEWAMVLSFLFLLFTFERELCAFKLNITLVGFQREGYEPLSVRSGDIEV